jgi:hypothetical protein
LNPLAPPTQRLEWIRKVLGLVHHFAIPERHDACRERLPVLVVDDLFRNPEVALPLHSPDYETRGLARVITSQGLQIGSPQDSLA